MKVKLAAFFIAASVFAPSAMAQENAGYNKVYDATYDYYMPSGPTQMRLSCDGGGRIRSETVMNGRSFVSITDANQKATFSIDDSTKAVSKMAMQNAPGVPTGNSSQRTSLGDKIVEGRLCEGWQTTTASGKKSEAWIDKTLGCPVLITLDNKPQMKIRTSSANSIGPQYFAPPPGYRLVDMNEQIRRAQENAKKYQNARRN